MQATGQQAVGVLQGLASVTVLTLPETSGGAIKTLGAH